ncbi:MAG: hypothetical protein HFJ94_03910 [Muribaculaceae bacterium]|nr:hypothetical protein [Muribaculaceae bacterium]
MDVDKIKKMLDKYYSGNILPEEYQILISVLKEADELIPELEAERRILLAIESYAPIEPNGFEERLKMAIDRRRKRNRTFLRIVFSGSAAAIVFALIAIGQHIHNNGSTYDMEPIPKISAVHEMPMTNETIDTKDAVNATYVVSVAHDNPPSYSNANEDLEKSLQIADQALIDVLANIHVAQNEVMEVIDKFEISQTTDYNTL